MSDYWDRVRPAEATLATITSHFERYGITRVAKQTSLDTIGIPVFVAFRPNAATLATAQGKGLTDVAAKVSAAMEAIEYAVAEQPECEIFRASANEFSSSGVATFIAAGTLPDGIEIPQDTSMSWVRGTNALDGSGIMVPLDLVWLSGHASDLHGICQHTNGLASGNTEEEAVFHALCELIERDAGSLWALTPTDERSRRVVAASDFSDQEVFRLAELIAASGLHLRLFDQTSDLGVPTIMAEIAPRGAGAAAHSEFSSGSGTHPVAVRAALRAITEAAQSRVTAIAATRDDLCDQLYSVRPEQQFCAIEPSQEQRSFGGLPAAAQLTELLAFLKERLVQSGIKTLPVVRLGGEAAGIVVVKVLAAELEDFGVNLNWRPGVRALTYLARETQ